MAETMGSTEHHDHKNHVPNNNHEKRIEKEKINMSFAHIAEKFGLENKPTGNPAILVSGEIGNSFIHSIGKERFFVRDSSSLNDSALTVVNLNVKNYETAVKIIQEAIDSNTKRRRLLNVLNTELGSRFPGGKINYKSETIGDGNYFVIQPDTLNSHKQVANVKYISNEPITGDIKKDEAIFIKTLIRMERDVRKSPLNPQGGNDRESGASQQTTNQELQEGHQMQAQNAMRNNEMSLNRTLDSVSQNVGSSGLPFEVTRSNGGLEIKLVSGRPAKDDWARHGENKFTFPILRLSPEMGGVGIDAMQSSLSFDKFTKKVESIRQGQRVNFSTEDIPERLRNNVNAGQLQALAKIITNTVR